jgi:hypothetical protein
MLVKYIGIISLRLRSQTRPRQCSPAHVERTEFKCGMSEVLYGLSQVKLEIFPTSNAVAMVPIMPLHAFCTSSLKPPPDSALLLPLSFRPRRHLRIFLIDLRIRLISLILHHSLLLEVLDLYPNRQHFSIFPKYMPNTPNSLRSPFQILHSPWDTSAATAHRLSWRLVCCVCPDTCRRGPAIRSTGLVHFDRGQHSRHLSTSLGRA